MRRRHIQPAGHSVQIFDAQFAILALAACGQPFFHSFDLRIRHLCLRKYLRAEVVEVAGVVRDNQAVRFLISHVTPPQKSNSKLKSPVEDYPKPKRLAIQARCQVTVTAGRAAVESQISCKCRPSRRKASLSIHRSYCTRPHRKCDVIRTFVGDALKCDLQQASPDQLVDRLSKPEFSPLFVPDQIVREAIREEILQRARTAGPEDAV